jgi:bifunctional enzyme CysN/CysC
MNAPHWHEPTVSRDDRWKKFGLRGMSIWITGFSGSGKSTVAHELARQLVQAGTLAVVLDADNLRHGLNADLGFSDDDRRENVRRVGQVAALLADTGVVTIVPIISPFKEGRDAVRAVHERTGLRFIEVHMATPIDECANRDPKGLYRKVRDGEMTGLSGVDAPYEAPSSPDFVLGAHGESVDQCVEALFEAVRKASVR